MEGWRDHTLEPDPANDGRVSPLHRGVQRRRRARGRRSTGRRRRDSGGRRQHPCPGRLPALEQHLRKEGVSFQLFSAPAFLWRGYHLLEPSPAAGIFHSKRKDRAPRPVTRVDFLMAGWEYPTTSTAHAVVVHPGQAFQRWAQGEVPKSMIPTWRKQY